MLDVVVVQLDLFDRTLQIEIAVDHRAGGGCGSRRPWQTSHPGAESSGPSEFPNSALISSANR